MSRLEEIAGRADLLDLSEGWLSEDEDFDENDGGVIFSKEEWPFIVHAPWDILWLIEEVDRLQRVLSATERLAEGSCDRIAELQAELAKFKPCEMGFCGAHQVGLDYRKAYHKEP